MKKKIMLVFMLQEIFLILKESTIMHTYISLIHLSLIVV